MGNTILLVDSDHRFVRMARLYLGNSGFDVEVRADSQDAVDQIRDLHPDLVVFDVMSGSESSEICRQLRGVSDVPLILTSSQSGDDERIASLEDGADDFLAKPLNPKELVARVKAILRRTQAPARPSREIRVADLHLDTAQREAYIGDRQIHLRPKEFGLLEMLASHPGRVIGKEDLMMAVWGHGTAGDDRTLVVHMTWLRAKLAGSQVVLRSVRGVGYKLVA
jgi:DNA-binding response OmpR family regulator